MRVSPRQTIMAEWQALVNEAISLCSYDMEDALRHYLIITLDHFTTDKQLASVIIAFDFLHSLESFGQEKHILLRQVGDRCLLLAGLFPEQANKRLVTIEYFIGIGRQAYETLAHIQAHSPYDSELFHRLSEEFVHLINVLQAMRATSIYTQH